jgi:hypothetical protein
MNIYLSLNCVEVIPSRSVNHERHNRTRYKGSNWKSDEPSTVDPKYHTPVDRFRVSRTKTNSDSGTSDALRCRDGYLETGR